MFSILFYTYIAEQNKTKKMNLRKKTALLQKAIELLELIEYAQKRIETRKRYIEADRFYWLYPNIVERNIEANKITLGAIDRIYKYYTEIINQLQKLK